MDIIDSLGYKASARIEEVPLQGMQRHHEPSTWQEYLRLLIEDTQAREGMAEAARVRSITCSVGPLGFPGHAMRTCAHCSELCLPNTMRSFCAWPLPIFPTCCWRTRRSSRFSRSYHPSFTHAF